MALHPFSQKFITPAEVSMAFDAAPLRSLNSNLGANRSLPRSWPSLSSTERAYPSFLFPFCFFSFLSPLVPPFSTRRARFLSGRPVCAPLLTTARLARARSLGGPRGPRFPESAGTRLILTSLISAATIRCVKIRRVSDESRRRNLLAKPAHKGQSGWQHGAFVKKREWWGFREGVEAEGERERERVVGRRGREGWRGRDRMKKESRRGGRPRGD